MNELLLLATLLLGASKSEAAALPFRIIGGETVPIEDFPYQVALERGFHFCGGAIISKKYVVSASHCFPDMSVSSEVPKGLYVRVGANNLRNEGQLVEVARVTRHPKADFVRYDIAILELKTPLNYSNKVQPVKLPGKGDVLKPGNVAYVTGYGLTNKPDYKNTLEMVEVPVMSNTECDKYYKNLIAEYMFCAGYKEGGKDACQGDSGGPLVYSGKLFGVVSWGDECASPDAPGVYTNVTYFLPFIKEITGMKL